MLDIQKIKTEVYSLCDDTKNWLSNKDYKSLNKEFPEEFNEMSH